jgi:cytochrome bd ubiquinol oxidase subunit I
LLGSLILTHSLDGEVRGLKEVPPSERPPVIPVFFAFRIMVGCGMLMLCIVAASLVLRWRRRLYDMKLFQVACMAGVPLGFIATIAGWTVTEVGRQPYVVYGFLRTAQAASPLAGGAVLGSLAVALLLYNLLLLGFFWYAGRLALRGPSFQLPATAVAPTAAIAGSIGLLHPMKGGDR